MARSPLPSGRRSGTGSLPAEIKIVQNTQVGPSLGADSIRKGWRAVIVGLVLVAVFMVVYYRVSGVFAVVALTSNLVLLVGALAAAGATLTLPGIAGIVLTIGMAVDYHRRRAVLSWNRPDTRLCGDAEHRHLHLGVHD